jgi:tricorn protease-like protein
LFLYLCSGDQTGERIGLFNLMRLLAFKDIYSYSLANKKLTRLTQHKGIDTEASYSPDGKNLVFTSNRSGQAQIGNTIKTG